MGLTESVCTLSPAAFSYSCSASTVQIPDAAAGLYENYELGAYKSFTVQTSTYTFDCVINEQTLFGKVYCDGTGNKVTVSCGNNSQTIDTRSLKKSFIISPCSFIFDFYKTGFTLLSANDRASIYSTNRFYALPKEVKSDVSDKTEWKLLKRENSDGSSSSKSSGNYDHMEIKERLNV
ncbi:hypothetical protein cpbgf_4004510 [Cryptosporidium parvum]|uniref:Uncharacterized protein n=1 Tax=Cryptosporidium parvum TaxID=5807 RepID=A0A7S7LJF9_CRYPV|nr:Uncharacterized protein CPATCC_0021770 [Cryptosporidium parvum]WRK31678.1 hypothetical protein cpbgf_4004510 [Cryptosporidium parvum]|eukprot:QOY42346.1 hypothetical protein CPATCC_001985 [Cryptosporidium parvum]